MPKLNTTDRSYKIDTCGDCGQGINKVGNRIRCSACSDAHTIEKRRLASIAKRAAAREAKENSHNV